MKALALATKAAAVVKLAADTQSACFALYTVQIITDVRH